MPDSGEPTGSSKSPSHVLFSKTSFFNLKLYILIAILAISVLLVCLAVFFCVCLNRSSRKRKVKHSSGLIPLVSREIIELKASESKVNRFIEEGKTGNVDAKKSGEGTSDELSAASDASSAEVANIGWGRWYSLKELEAATRGFADENVVGEGGYGVVYRGVLTDGSVVAVKNLLNNRGQAEKEFKVEVEAIGKVRHKNLVGLVGYCAEGPQRMLVYEYVDNGNLEQWLHGDVGPVSPLSWEIRMKIAIGTAKGRDINAGNNTTDAE